MAPIRPKDPNGDQPEVADGGVQGANAEEEQGVEDRSSENAGLHDQIEEGRIPQKLPAPQHVSQAEREEHEVTHTRPTGPGASSASKDAEGKAPTATKITPRVGEVSPRSPWITSSYPRLIRRRAQTRCL